MIRRGAGQQTLLPTWLKAQKKVVLTNKTARAFKNKEPGNEGQAENFLVDDSKEDLVRGQEPTDKLPSAMSPQATNLLRTHTQAEAALKKDQDRLKAEREARIKQRLAWRR
jgi:hypothetical protein